MANIAIAPTKRIKAFIVRVRGVFILNLLLLIMSAFSLRCSY